MWGGPVPKERTIFGQNTWSNYWLGGKMSHKNVLIIVKFHSRWLKDRANEHGPWLRCFEESTEEACWLLSLYHIPSRCIIFQAVSFGQPAAEFARGNNKRFSSIPVFSELQASLPQEQNLSLQDLQVCRLTLPCTILSLAIAVSGWTHLNWRPKWENSASTRGPMLMSPSTVRGKSSWSIH